MAATLHPGEEAQLLQTIEMFEVIAQSQPHDYQSLEILKEAYSKLGREPDVIATSKRIAEAYLHQGQLSSAILEYETVLQRRPNDADVQTALRRIEDTASNTVWLEAEKTPEPPPENPKTKIKKAASPAAEIDDGRQMLRRVFVDDKVISAGDFDAYWPVPDAATPADVATPFIQTLADKAVLPVEKSLKLLSDKSRAGFLPLEKYDVDIELTRGFSAAVCRRWCVLPFDRMSKAILVATANPFNQQAMKELAEATSQRLLWYLAPPTDLVNYLRKVFR